MARKRFIKTDISIAKSRLPSYLQNHKPVILEFVTDCYFFDTVSVSRKEELFALKGQI